ncbi:MAG: redoxin domain-containing protein [Pirellulaceae bacterium]|nr:redoxin domain-containing protein [Pirellulaceae bacterium]
MKSFVLCAIVSCCFLTLLVTESSAQEAADKKVPVTTAPNIAATASKSVPKTDKDQLTKQADDEEPEKKVEKKLSPLEEVRDLLSKRKVDQAAKVLDEALAKNPGDAKLIKLRGSIASGYLRTRQYDKAFEQSEKLVEYQIDHLDDAANRAGIVSSLSMMRLFATRTDKKETAEKLIDQAFDALEQATADKPLEFVRRMPQMVTTRASYLASAGKSDEAHQLIDQYVDRIDAAELSGENEAVKAVGKLRLLTSAAILPGAESEQRGRLDEFLSQSIEQHADSNEVLSAYTQGQLMLISRTYRDEPENAQQRIEKVGALVTSKADKSNDVIIKSFLRQLKSFESRIESALKLKAMIGKPAPAMDIEAWVNQGDITRESLDGKVLLIDFWSVWCGPCIMTFPHLRQWREEFGDQGFEIVGVTRYYNYTWDDETERATRSKDEVDPETEQETIAKFMQHHELRHPTIITPQGSDMQKEYGVTGIPHVVLVDREGIVQFVKVGAGESTAAAIHAKLKELVGS